MPFKWVDDAVGYWRHFSKSQDLVRTDPGRFGTGLRGPDLDRVRQSGGPGRTYFYLDPDARPEQGTGPFEYVAEVDQSQIYDFDSDPRGLVREARAASTTPDKPTEFGLIMGGVDKAAARNRAEQAVLDAGYRGFSYTDPQTGLVGVLFDEQDVRPAADYFPARATRETAPGATVKGHLPGISADPELKRAYDNRVRELLYPEGRDPFTSDLGMESERVGTGVGVYGGQSSPGHVSLVRGNPDDLNITESVYALLNTQDAYGFNRPSFGGSANSLSVDIGRPLSESEMGALSSRLSELDPDAFPALTPTGVDLIHPGFEGDAKELRSIFSQAVEAAGLGGARQTPLSSSTGYMENDWSKSPMGQAYVDRIMQGTPEQIAAADALVKRLARERNAIDMEFADAAGGVNADVIRMREILAEKGVSGLASDPTPPKPRKPRLDPKAPVAAGMAALAAQSEEAEAAPMGTLADGIKMATRQAYHGSPHDFDKFSLAKIGTGEGAQAYGHGLYFSSKKDIADFYRNNLSAHLARSVDPAYKAAAKSFKDSGYSREDAIKGLQQAYPDADPEDLKYAFDGKPGKLYTVEIPDESNMLDWDKPLSEQPEAVKKAVQSLDPLILKRAKINENTRGYELYRELLKPEVNTWMNTPAPGHHWEKGVRGKAVLHQIVRDSDGAVVGEGTLKREALDAAGMGRADQAASQTLRELGIPGITYKGATSDERNFVVFDDELINMIQKGLVDPKLLAPMAAGAATIGYATSEFAAAESSLNATEPDLQASSERFNALRKGKRAQRLSQELERVLAPVAGPAKALMDAAEVMLVSVAGGIPGYLSELTGYVRGQDLEEAKAGGEALAGKLTGSMAEALGEDWDPQNPYLQGLAKAMEQGEKEFQDAYRMLGVENSVMKKGWDQLPERAQRIITGLADLAL